MSYKVVRFFFKGERETIEEGLTLEEAQEHCSGTETSSRTATSDEAVAITQARGPWFDGYDEE